MQYLRSRFDTAYTSTVEHIENYQWVLNLIIPYKNLYILATIAGILCSYFGLLVPHKMTAWFSSAMNTDSDNLGYAVIYEIALLQFVASLFAGIRGGMYSYLHNITYMHTYKILLNTVMQIPMELWDTDVVPTELNKTILSHIRDVSQFTGMTINVFYRSLSGILTITYFLYPLSARLYLVCMLSASANIAVAHIISKHYQRITTKMQKTREVIDKHSQEFVTNYTSMRLYRMENTQMDRCHTNLMKLKDVSFEEGYTYGLYQFVFAMFPRICEITYIITIFYLGFRANFWECLTYYGVMSDTVNICKDTFFSISRSRDAIHALKKYMLMESNIQKKIPLDIGHGGVIEFCDVTFAYPTKPDIDVLDHFNESIHIGDKIAFIGTSGIGKTTLIKLIMGLYDSYKAGNICYNGYSLRDYTIVDSVAIVPQEPTYYSEKTIRENVLIGNTSSSAHKSPIYTDEHIIDVLRRVKLDFLVDNLDNIQANLSGGQKQRIAVARVLLTDRPIVVLDEPSSSLDKDTEKVVIAELSEYFKDRTVILITHNLDIIADDFRRVYL